MNTNPKAYLLIDGDCSLCQAINQHWARWMQENNIQAKAYQDYKDQADFPLSQQELSEAVHLIFDSGSTLKGPDVFRYYLKTQKKFWLFYVITTWPVFKQLFDWAYKMVAKHRKHII